MVRYATIKRSKMAEVVDIDLGPRIKGRAQRPLTAVVVRALTQADLEKLKVERGVKPVSLQRIRDTHHFLARYLALGAGPAEASAVTGYSVNRISILLGDPSFQQLLTFYRDDRNKEYLQMKAHVEERLMANMLTAEAKITEQLEDDENDLSIMQLNKLVEMRADRLGYGPTSKSSNVSVLVDAAALQAMKERLTKHLETRDLGALEFHHEQGAIIEEAAQVAYNGNSPSPSPSVPAPVSVEDPDTTAGAGLEKPRLGVPDDDRR
jgi:hypothetical protein